MCQAFIKKKERNNEKIEFNELKLFAEEIEDLWILVEKMNEISYRSNKLLISIFNNKNFYDKEVS